MVQSPVTATSTLLTRPSLVTALKELSKCHCISACLGACMSGRVHVCVCVSMYVCVCEYVCVYFGLDSCTCSFLCRLFVLFGVLINACFYSSVVSELAPPTCGGCVDQYCTVLCCCSFSGLEQSHAVAVSVLWELAPLNCYCWLERCYG